MDEWVRQVTKVGQAWADEASEYFKDTWGMDSVVAVRAALLYLALHFAGLQPRITSGFRDPVKQRAMRAAWDAGNRAGLRARPADPDKSDHCKTGILGRPAARGIDIVSRDEHLAAKIGQALGWTPGLYFTPADPGHYSWR